MVLPSQIPSFLRFSSLTLHWPNLTSIFPYMQMVLTFLSNLKATPAILAVKKTNIFFCKSEHLQMLGDETHIILSEARILLSLQLSLKRFSLVDDQGVYLYRKQYFVNIYFTNTLGIYGFIKRWCKKFDNFKLLPFKYLFYQLFCICFFLPTLTLNKFKCAKLSQPYQKM